MAVEYASGYTIEIKPVPRMGSLQLAPGQAMSGYGKQISTDYIAVFGGKRYRVYAICYSNVASHYIRKGGIALYLRNGELSEAIEFARRSQS